jgi:hypothetical protein
MEWYKFVDEDVLIMVMTESKQPLDVINTLRKFADRLEAKIMVTEGGS